MSGLSKIGRMAENATILSIAPNNTLPGAFAAAMSQNNAGVFHMEMGEIKLGGIPKSTAFTAQNSNTAGAEDQTVYIFNEDVLNASPAVSADLLLVKKYNDGFTGKFINQLLKIANKGEGIRCKGFNIIMKDADGNQDLTALETAEFTIQSYTGIGGKTLPEVLDLSEALRNNQFQQGLLSIECSFWVSAITQVSMVVPKGYTVAVNFKWDR